MGIFEVHFHDSEFAPSMHLGPKEAPGTDAGADEAENERADEYEERDAGGRSAVLPVVVSVLFAVAVAVAVKKLKGGE